jgi:hypothetical protein
MSIATSFTHTSGSTFTSGATLNYRITPKNNVGYGNPSTATSVLCDQEPTFMNAPTNTSVKYNEITITWNVITDETDRGRDTIIYYSLEWFSRSCYSDPNTPCTATFVEPDDGTWIELTSYSDAANRLATSKVHSTAS